MVEDTARLREAPRSSAVNPSASSNAPTPELTAGRIHPLNCAVEVALAHNRIQSGEDVSLSDLALLGGVPEDEVRREIATPPRGNVTRAIARAWLRMRGVAGFSDQRRDHGARDEGL